MYHAAVTRVAQTVVSWLAANEDKRIYEDREIWKEYALLSRNGICREYALFGFVLTQI